jgi:hypothetical protein
MISYNEIDGIPAHINKWLLQDILRKEWNYKGITISDYFAIDNLHFRHFVAENNSEAARKALLAGVDMNLSEYGDYIALVEQIKQGKKGSVYYQLNSSIASNMATIFWGGTSGNILCTAANIKPPSFENISILRFTLSFTSPGVARLRIL